MSFIPGVLVETLAFTLNLAETGFAGHAGGQGLFQGIVPRVMLGIWQTLFMVTGRCSSLLQSPG